MDDGHRQWWRIGVTAAAMAGFFAYRAALLALVMSLPFANEAVAQQAVCIAPGTDRIDQNTTMRWQQLAQASDPRLMQALTGVWYMEIRAPATGQVDYHYNSHEPNGLYQYSSRVCSNGGAWCSDFAGHGMFVAYATGNAQFAHMYMTSDLKRDRLCTGGTARFIDQTTVQDSGGLIWKRVR